MTAKVSLADCQASNYFQYSEDKKKKKGFSVSKIVCYI